MTVRLPIFYRDVFEFAFRLGDFELDLRLQLLTLLTTLLFEQTLFLQRFLTSAAFGIVRFVVVRPSLHDVQAVIVKCPPAAKIRMASWLFRDVGVLVDEKLQTISHVLVLNRDLKRSFQTRVQIRVVVVGGDRRIGAFREQILKKFEVPVVLREIRRSM